MVLVMVLLLAKQIITLYHAVQKTPTKDQHALVNRQTDNGLARKNLASNAMCEGKGNRLGISRLRK